MSSEYESRTIDIRKGLIFNKGIPKEENEGCISFSIEKLVEEEEPNTFLVYKKPTTNTAIFEYDNCTDVACSREYDKFYFLTAIGGIWEFDTKLDSFNNLINVEEIDAGIMRNIICLDSGKLVAVGSGHKVLTVEPDGSWSLTELPSQRIPRGLESISKFHDDEIYAAGWGGEAFLWNGKSWSPVQPPTNNDIYCVKCLSDGIVYMCGNNGIILKGRKNQWTIIENNIFDDALWSIEEFKGRIYVAGWNRLFEIVDNTLQPLEDFPPATVHYLASCQEVLWAVGERHLYEFDGKMWKELFDLT